MAEPTIRDPALYQWRYFLRRWGRETQAERERLALSFGTELRRSLKWAGDPADEQELTLRLRRVLMPSDSQLSERLSTTEWNECDGTLRELEARTLLDTFYVELGQAVRGPQHSRVWFAFQDALPRLEEPPDGYVGEAVCLYGEADGGVGGDELRELSAAIARATTSSELRAEQLEGAVFPWGYFALVPSPDQETVLLIALEAESPDVAWFLHWVLPRLMLSRVKGRVVRSHYYAVLLPGAQRSESDLDAALNEAAQPRLGLEQLEGLGAKIARCQATLIEAASKLEESVETVRICVRNLELLLQDPVWGDPQRLREPLIGELRLFLEQMETDLRYLRITRGQANLALESLQTTAGVRAARWDRRLALAVAFFVMTGVASAFPELAWGWRLAIMMGGALVAAVGYWFLRRS